MLSVSIEDGVWIDIEAVVGGQGIPSNGTAGRVVSEWARAEHSPFRPTARHESDSKAASCSLSVPKVAWEFPGPVCVFLSPPQRARA